MHLRLLMEELEAVYEHAVSSTTDSHGPLPEIAGALMPPSPSMTLGESMKPFLRWNGGKRDRLHIISRLLQGFPCGQYSYVEPCVGGGSVYWAVGHRFRKRHIGDIDGELINLYRVLQTDCEGLLAELGNGEYWYHGYYVASKLNYHRLRHWEPESPVQRAARFLFLNQTCINGLMRVNGRGRLNAAPGKTVPHIDPANLRVCGGAAGHGGVPGRRVRGRGRAEEGSPGVPAGRSAVP